MFKKLLKSLKIINHKLFFALLIMGLVPVIYNTFRVYFLGNLPGDYSYSTVGLIDFINRTDVVLLFNVLVLKYNSK